MEEQRHFLDAVEDTDNCHYSQICHGFDYAMGPSILDFHRPTRVPINDKNTEFAVQDIPRVFMERFMTLLPSLSLRLFSYTCKGFYYMCLDIRGLEAECISYIDDIDNKDVQVTHSGRLVGHIRAFPRHLTKYLNIKGIINVDRSETKFTTREKRPALTASRLHMNRFPFGHARSFIHSKKTRQIYIKVRPGEYDATFVKEFKKLFARLKNVTDIILDIKINSRNTKQIFSTITKHLDTRTVPLIRFIVAINNHEYMYHDSQLMVVKHLPNNPTGAGPQQQHKCFYLSNSLDGKGYATNFIGIKRFKQKYCHLFKNPEFVNLDDWKPRK